MRERMRERENETNSDQYSEEPEKFGKQVLNLNPFFRKVQTPVLIRSPTRSFRNVRTQNKCSYVPETPFSLGTVFVRSRRKGFRERTKQVFVRSRNPPECWERTNTIPNCRGSCRCLHRAAPRDVRARPSGE